MIGDRIRQARLAAGMTQEEVVEHLARAGHQITKAALSKYEKEESDQTGVAGLAGEGARGQAGPLSERT